MGVLPCGNVFDRNLVVGMVFGICADVQHDQGSDQALRGDLIDGPESTREMRGSVDAGLKWLAEDGLGRKYSLLTLAAVLTRSPA